MIETVRPIVLVDMDNVLADFDSELIKRLLKRYPNAELSKKRQHFYLEHDYPEYANCVPDIYREPGFFRSLPLARHAIVGWQRLLDLGYQPQICTAAEEDSFDIITEKADWLLEHFVPKFGRYVLDTMIASRDKYLHSGIALIDDNPNIHNTELASWQHIIFDHPYNEGLAGPRLHGWNDDNLPNLLNDAMKLK